MKPPPTKSVHTMRRKDRCQQWHADAARKGAFRALEWFPSLATGEQTAFQCGEGDGDAEHLLRRSERGVDGDGKAKPPGRVAKVCPINVVVRGNDQRKVAEPK